MGQRDLALRGHKAGPRARGLHPRCNPVHPNQLHPNCTRCRKPHARRPIPAAPCLARPRAPWQVFSVAAGSARIASGSVDRTICLWDGRAPGCTATLTHGGGGHLS